MNGAEECVSLDACVCVSACAVCASERCCKPNSFSSMQREEEVTERQNERVGGKVTHPCAHWRREGERCVWVGVCVCAETGACFSVYNLSVLRGD